MCEHCNNVAISKIELKIVETYESGKTQETLTGITTPTMGGLALHVDGDPRLLALFCAAVFPEVERALRDILDGKVNPIPEDVQGMLQ